MCLWGLRVIGSSSQVGVTALVQEVRTVEGCCSDQHLSEYVLMLMVMVMEFEGPKIA